MVSVRSPRAGTNSLQLKRFSSVKIALDDQDSKEIVAMTPHDFETFSPHSLQS